MQPVAPEQGWAPSVAAIPSNSKFRLSVGKATSRDVLMYPGTHALTSPDRPALTMTAVDDVVTYAELEDRSRRAANWLIDAGLRSGDVVGVLSDNDCWFLISTGPLRPPACI